MIEIVKSSEFNARAVKSIDLANKIPGYNFWIQFFISGFEYY